MNSINTFFCSGVYGGLQVLNIQLFKNSHALSSTYPIVVCFRFCVKQLPYILIYLLIYYLLIYYSYLFHFSIVHTYMKKHHRLMPQYSMRKCSMCIFYGLLLWWYPGTLFLGFSLFLDFLCTHLVYLCFAVNHSRQSHKIFPI